MTRELYEGKESIKYGLFRIGDATNYVAENKSLLKRLSVYEKINNTS